MARSGARGLKGRLKRGPSQDLKGGLKGGA